MLFICLFKFLSKRTSYPGIELEILSLPHPHPHQSRIPGWVGLAVEGGALTVDIADRAPSPRAQFCGPYKVVGPLEFCQGVHAYSTPLVLPRKCGVFATKRFIVLQEPHQSCTEIIKHLKLTKALFAFNLVYHSIHRRPDYK